uniref:Integrin alpha-2 domain-containing protein n=1 Tax=Ditylenchus dipsaci TaxID=166011 RepID=A0A915D5W1_9BILA
MWSWRIPFLKNMLKDGGKLCPSNTQTCFSVTTSISVKNRNNTNDLLNFNEEPFICALQIIPFSKGVAPRGVFTERNKASISWDCGRNTISNTQQTTYQVFVPKANQDWTNPLKFNFTVNMRERRSVELLPIINQKQAEHIFSISFDKRCGEDNDCHTDLVLNAILLNMTMKDDGSYITKVTERDSIVIRFIVENRRERAFLAKLYLRYNQDELDEPQLLNKVALSVDIERKENGLATLNLGNPLEEKKKISFDLSFNLVRGSSERVSASLFFDASVNSSSIEEVPLDNRWKAELQLIKEADLQLEGASTPSIVRFSKGSRSAVDEEDIGLQVVHAYTLTNHGPFYAKNVTVTINWPLKLNTEKENWVLYTLEEPIIRHNGEIRKCKVDSLLKAVNPIGVYNDETLKLTYEPGSTEFRNRKPRSVSVSSLGGGNICSIVKIVDVNCKDSTAICVPLVCRFDFISKNDAALIEIRARLWNHTFSGDYKGIEYVAITSEGFVEVDMAQGIMEDLKNNFAKVTTYAYPDRPAQEKIDIWLIILAVCVGLLLLAILVLICWRCGFFKRKRRQDILLHTANYKHEMEQYSES